MADADQRTGEATSRRLVCVLEDDLAVQRIATRALEESGFTVFVTDAWPTLCQKIIATREDVVLVSDLQLPGIGGEDFCKTILKHRPGTKIVIYSSIDPNQGLEIAKRLNVTFISKKQGIQVLRDAVRRLGVTSNSGRLPRAVENLMTPPDGTPILKRRTPPE